MPTDYRKFQIACAQCGQITTKAHYRQHAGLCKYCVAGKDSPATLRDDTTSRNSRLIDSGYSAYAREEGYYDQGDY